MVISHIVDAMSLIVALLKYLKMVYFLKHHRKDFFVMYTFQNGIMRKKAEGKMSKFVSESWILCVRYCRLGWQNFYLKLLFKIS